MATIYVKSSATGANDGTSWTDAYTSITSTFSAAAGDVVLVSDTHSETFSASTYFDYVNGTAYKPIPVICVNESTGQPSTGAILELASGAYNFYFGDGSAYYYGIEFRTYAGAVNQQFSFSIQPVSPQPTKTTFENCTFRLRSTGASSYTTIGHASNDADFCDVVFINTNYITSSANNRIYFNRNGRLTWIGGSWTGTLPTAGLFFVQSAGYPTSINCYLNAVDLSAAGSGVLFGSIVGGVMMLENCKLGSGMSIVSGPTWTSANSEIYLYNCASWDAHYLFQHFNSRGYTSITSSIYANDGAEYNTTGNKYSWKITTNVNCSYYTPYVSPWIHKYNESTSATMVSLEGLLTGSTTVLKDDEVWGEFSYQGTSGYPLGVIVTDRMALLGTAADQTSSKAYSDWTGGTSSDSTFKLATPSTITPAEIGNISARVCVAKPSTTIYIDPQVRTS